MKIVPGRRVYIPSIGTFGSVVKEGGILGLSNSFAIIDDTGKKMVFVEDTPEFVYVDTKEDVSGNKVSIPDDVVPLFRKNLGQIEAGKMTKQFYEMKEQDRQVMCKEWMSCEGRPVSKHVVEDKRPLTRKKKSSKKY